MTLKTIDAHVGGGLVRLVIEGFPSPLGRTMSAKRTWAARHADDIRRALMLEPRGHADILGAVLTEPTEPGSHAGVLFMDADGYKPLSGHGIVAVTTIALERRLLMAGGDGGDVVFDTPVGAVRSVAVCAAGMAPSGGRGPDHGRATLRVESVAVVLAPSFVLHAGIEISLGSRRVRADIAFGGAFYAVVDGESVGLPLDVAHLPELRRAGTEITRAVDAMLTLVHPVRPDITGMSGTIFTGPARDGTADLRNVAVLGSGSVQRSAAGTGTAAVMAIVDAMGLLDDCRAFVHESLIGTTLSGRVAGRTLVGEVPAIIPEIGGTAWITGEHTFLLSEDDPLRAGFRV